MTRHDPPPPFSGPFTAADWLAGSTVRFADQNAVIDVVRHPNPEPVVASGIVNGPAIAIDADGRPVMVVVVHDGAELDLAAWWLVPCWCEREGREASTVYVDSRNILDVTHPAPYSPTDRHDR